MDILRETQNNIKDFNHPKQGPAKGHICYSGSFDWEQEERFLNDTEVITLK